MWEVRRECLTLRVAYCARAEGGAAGKAQCPSGFPLWDHITPEGVYSIPLPAPLFHSALLRGLPLCTFFIRCLILTQKIAGFNSFARWLRKEQLTASAKCLCQSPKQPIPINIKSRTDLLTCKGKLLEWWNLTLADQARTLSTHPSQTPTRPGLRGCICKGGGNVNRRPKDAPGSPGRASPQSHTPAVFALFGWMQHVVVVSKMISCLLKWDLFHRSGDITFKWMIHFFFKIYLFDRSHIYRGHNKNEIKRSKLR